MSDNILPMAWNEPGSGDKDKKDPWGKRKSESDGPPDLDQVLKNLWQKIRTSFGFKGPTNQTPTSGSGKGSEIWVSVVLVAVLLGYLGLGFYTIAEYEHGVITRFGKYSHTVNSGLHWLPLFMDKVQKVNTGNIKSSRHSGWMLTKDENIILVEMEVQYRVLDAEKYLFDVASPDGVLGQAADSALRQVIGDSFTDDVLTNKKLQIAEAIKDQLVLTLERYGAGFHIEQVNFRDSRPPDDVKDAFDDVTKSREDRERLKLQAEAYANTIIPEAEGAASKILSEAEAFKEQVTLDATGETQRFNLILPGYQKAPQVTRTRMYLDSMGQVLSNTTTVIVSANGNNMIYLPLDKILEKQQQKNQIVVPYNPEVVNTNNQTQLSSKREKGQ